MANHRKPSANVAKVSSVPSERFERQSGRILDAATRLLNRLGVTGMTVVEVAKSLGLKNTAVTYYFRYKEQLVEAVFADSLTRLGDMVREAACQSTPRLRVERYLQLHFDLHAAALREEARPLANLAEIRSLEPLLRSRLIAQYQEVFRAVRGFFGPIDSEESRLDFTARAQMLNETLFWSAIWLKDYAIGDFDTVRRQLLQILESGIAEADAQIEPILVPMPEDESDRDAAAAFLKIATRLLNEIGYRGTSIDRIAAELNLTKGSFYHHLDTKDDLILECFRNNYRRLGRLHRTLSGLTNSKAQLLLSIIANTLRVQFGTDYPLLRITAMQALPPPLREIPMAHSQRSTLLLNGLMVDACQEGVVRRVNPLLASHVVMSAIDSAFDIRSWAAKQDPDLAVGRYIDVILYGVLRNPREKPDPNEDAKRHSDDRAHTHH